MSHKLGLLPAGCFSEGNIHIPVGVDSKRGKQRVSRALEIHLHRRVYMNLVLAAEPVVRAVPHAKLNGQARVSFWFYQAEVRS